jgi:hypothetical protein
MPLQAAMVAKLDANAEQAAANGLRLDDEGANSDESGDRSSPPANQSGTGAIEGPGAGRGPARNRAERPPDAVWQPGSAKPWTSMKVHLRAAEVDENMVLVMLFPLLYATNH